MAITTINKDELIAGVKDSLGLRAETPNSYIEYLLKLTVIDLSKQFSTLFYEEATKNTDANGKIDLPYDTFKIISVSANSMEARPLDLREYTLYQNHTLTYNDSLFATVKQEKDKVELRLLPVGSYTNVKIIYQFLNGGVGSIPLQYEEVVFTGVRWRYLRTKRSLDPKIVGQAKSDYKEEYNRLRLDQNKMYPNPRYKAYWENEWESNFTFSVVDQTRDTYNY